MSDYRDELQTIRDRYDGRRTVPQQLLDDALRLVDAEVRLQETRLAGESATNDARHEHRHTEATIPFPEFAIDPPRVVKTADPGTPGRPWWKPAGPVRPIVLAIAVSLLLVASTLLGRLS